MILFAGIILIKFKDRIISERIQPCRLTCCRGCIHGSLEDKRCWKRTPVHAVYLAVKVPIKLEDNAHARNKFCIVAAILGSVW
jgi:hypothetical protein